MFRENRALQSYACYGDESDERISANEEQDYDQNFWPQHDAKADQEKHPKRQDRVHGDTPCELQSL